MSMKNMISRALEKKQKQQKSASEEYRDLLHKHSTVPDEQWTEADESRLLDLVSELKISHEQAMKDAETVDALYENQRLSSQISALSKASDKAFQAQQKALEDRQRIFAEINAKVAAANGASEDAFVQLQQAQKAKGKLDQLREAYPHLVK